MGKIGVNDGVKMHRLAAWIRKASACACPSIRLISALEVASICCILFFKGREKSHVKRADSWAKTRENLYSHRR
jgi:hypothetical protein